jgi:hypothetical protein
MGNSHHPEKTELNHIIEVAPGFYNIRSSFKTFAGLIDIGTHMSLLKLTTGKFLVVDTVPLTPELKTQIDNLTQGGTLIDAVIASHPFHTLAFPAFYQAYPDLRYFGTPRHIRRLKDIPWVGDLNVEETRKLWEPEVQMRIPAGAEFVAPEPEAYNHFNSVWVFYAPGRTIHVDDTVLYFQNPGTIIKLAGKKKGEMEFHSSMHGPGLYPTPEAPLLFKAWVEDILKDWDFDNICCAHIGNKIGGAKALLGDVLIAAQPEFDKLIKKNTKKVEKEEVDKEDEDYKDCEKYNVDGTECG